MRDGRRGRRWRERALDNAAIDVVVGGERLRRNCKGGRGGGAVSSLVVVTRLPRASLLSMNGQEIREGNSKTKSAFLVVSRSEKSRETLLLSYFLVLFAGKKKLIPPLSLSLVFPSSSFFLKKKSNPVLPIAHAQLGGGGRGGGGGGGFGGGGNRGGGGGGGFGGGGNRGGGGGGGGGCC